jgi:hypothetical protein
VRTHFSAGYRGEATRADRSCPRWLRAAVLLDSLLGTRRHFRRNPYSDLTPTQTPAPTVVKSAPLVVPGRSSPRRLQVVLLRSSCAIQRSVFAGCGARPGLRGSICLIGPHPVSFMVATTTKSIVDGKLFARARDVVRRIAKSLEGMLLGTGLTLPLAGIVIAIATGDSAHGARRSNAS